MCLLRTAAIAAASFVLAAGCSSKGGAMTGMGGTGGGSSLCPVEDDLISSFTQDNGVFPTDGRQGGWYTYGDKSGYGMLEPPEGGAATPDLTTGNPVCSGPGSLHVKSIDFRDWGSAMGVDFVPKTVNDAGVAVKGTYDASKYRGIAFWARATAPIPFVQVSMLDPYTAIPSVAPADQQCDYKPADPTVNCSPYLVKFGYGYVGDAMTDVMADYGKFINTKIDETWKRFEILFADMKQDRTNPGRQSPGNKLAVSQIMGMAIQVNTDHSTVPPTPTDWEMWVDDVSFIK
jgi:hypothetical protein